LEDRLASGKKSYFRHYNDAFNDAKIQKAIELLGYQGYAYYFILVELFAKHCENEMKDPIVIHQQTVRILLRKSQQSCNNVIRKLEESGLFYVTFTKSFYEFSIPNLSKYLGKYETKFPPNAPNKRKEKKRKEKEIKEENPKPVLDPSDGIKLNDVFDDIGALWNEMASLNALPKVKVPLSKDRKKKMIQSVKEFPNYEDWVRIINGVLDNDFNLGFNDRKWKANFDWLFHTTKFNYRKLWEAHVEN
jgi:hypothetical protein